MPRGFMFSCFWTRVVVRIPSCNFLGAPHDSLSSQTHAAQRYSTTPDAGLLVTCDDLEFGLYGPNRTMLGRLLSVC